VSHFDGRLQVKTQHIDIPLSRYLDSSHITTMLLKRCRKRQRNTGKKMKTLGDNDGKEVEN